jgi:hypothetical protein
MSKRFTFKEDQFIAAYFEAIGDYIGPHDLGRPIGSVAKRAKYLKDTGAWDALKAIKYYEWAYRVATDQMGIQDEDYPEGYAPPAPYPHPAVELRLVSGGRKE